MINWFIIFNKLKVLSENIILIGVIYWAYWIRDWRNRCSLLGERYKLCIFIQYCQVIMNGKETYFWINFPYFFLRNINSIWCLVSRGLKPSDRFIDFYQWRFLALCLVKLSSTQEVAGINNCRSIKIIIVTSFIRTCSNK